MIRGKIEKQKAKQKTTKPETANKRWNKIIAAQERKKRYKLVTSPYDIDKKGLATKENRRGMKTWE